MFACISFPFSFNYSSKFFFFLYFPVNILFLFPRLFFFFPSFAPLIVFVLQQLFPSQLPNLQNTINCSHLPVERSEKKMSKKQVQKVQVRSDKDMKQVIILSAEFFPPALANQEKKRAFQKKKKKKKKKKPFKVPPCSPIKQINLYEKEKKNGSR